jgi:membrane-associated phospholipid phosphatase
VIVAVRSVGTRVDLMRNSWARAWIATFAVLLAIGALARRNNSVLLEVEEPVMDWLLDGTDTSGWKTAEIFGNPWLVYPGTLILAAITYRFSRTVAITIVATMVGGVALSLITKAIVDRPRPLDDLDASGSSFPSTHVVQAGIFFGLLTLVLWWFRTPRLLVQIVFELSIVAVLLTAIARVAGGYHWPSDVLGAAVVVALSLISAAVILELRAPERTSTVSRSSSPVTT